MRIGLYHGYELTGSGSNEYTRYLARFFTERSHEVHILCREKNPDQIPYVTHAFEWFIDGGKYELFKRPEKSLPCYLHQLPVGAVYPVYLTDKQRAGNVKSFVSLTDDELDEFHQVNADVLTAILSEFNLDILHANHLVYQPIAALEACKKTSTPLIVYPHGSSIEYTVRTDKRFRKLALDSVLKSSGLIIGNHEVRDRVLSLYPDHASTIMKKTQIVGVGVDTKLFKPIQRSQRYHSIQQLHAIENPTDGKSQELTNELYTRIADGDIHITQEYYDRYNHSVPDRDLATRIDRIPWDQKIVLFVGALTVGKGLQSLITAFKTVVNNGKNRHLVIIGAGSYREVLEALILAIDTGDESLLRNLCQNGLDLDRNELSGPWADVQAYIDDPTKREELIQTRGFQLSNHIHFLGRFDHERLHYVFPCADLAVFPSVVPEAYPLVLMESLANGVFPLVSYFSGFKDGIDELEKFLDPTLVDKMKIPTDPTTRIPTLISNINNLLSDNSLDELRPSLCRIAAENYDWNIQAAKMTAAYQEVIDRCSGHVEGS